MPSKPSPSGRLFASRPRIEGRATDRTPFEEREPPIEDTTAMDVWGGWLGEGLGASKSLYMSSSTRKGGRSVIYRLDEGGTEWVNDEAPEGAETISKIRSNASTIYAFFETPPSGKTWMISKSLESEGGWEFEGVPSHGGPVGGRGLAINGAEGERVLGGASQDWNAGGASAEVYEKSGEGWTEHRTVDPSLIWELEFDGEDRLWEFFSDFDRGHTAALFVDGEEKTYPPGHCIASAAWFKGHMYVIGNLVNFEAANKIYRSADGGEWEEVYTLSHATQGDHVKMIPRGGEDGELWYTGRHPFEAGYFDGETWTREESLPSIETDNPEDIDTNQRTGIGYWGPDTDDELERGVWILVRDQEAGVSRIFSDHGAGSLMLQVI